MRPTRLELEGFASFRQPTEIDFGDADLFVLSGPTGSGKSSVIDAMTFALFGIVARYDDKRMVEPVISRGRNEARVALHFQVDGVNHTAVRVVRRTRGGGASTKEARLERWRGDDPGDTRPLADTAASVSAEVERLLGLGYDHFTRTVVLPQGAFQEFLHGSQSERADLLNQLLAVDVFDHVARQARTRASTLDGELKGLRARLEGDLAEVTDAHLATAERRVADLQAAVDVIAEAAGDLEDILAAGRAQAETVTALERQAEALGAIEPPDGLDDLVSESSAAADALETADEALAAAERARDEADQRVDDLPAAAALAAQADVLAQADTLADQAEQATIALREASTAHHRATAALETARADLVAADEHLDRARQADLAATLAATLHVGDDCPVCSRPVTDPVEVDAAHLDEATTARDEAQRAHDAARRSQGEADKALSRAQSRCDHLAEQREQVAGRIAAAELPDDPDELQELASTVADATAARDEARSTVKRARSQRQEAATRRDAAVRLHGRARTVLTRARDRVADQHPPSVVPDQLGAAWDALLAWATARRTTLTAEIQAARSARDDSRSRYGEALAQLRRQVAHDDVDVDGINQPGPLRDAYLAALHRAQATRDRMRERQAQRDQTLAEVRAREQERAVATSLGQLLDKRNFQQWLTTRAVRHLVVGANRHLDQLSGGAYALTLDDGGNFAVVDHANGGEHRPARSLSGGETFLASLSLALALSESVADLAAGGAARLESLFIDEGFGTLDAATIDVVRTALEELGATGRMVGVVTHVPALAEQLPVQFRVRKQAQSSTVERLEA